jgi:hypothetical protein
MNRFEPLNSEHSFVIFAFVSLHTTTHTISKAIPPTAPQYGPNENSEWVDKGAKAFASDGDRDQFIC